MYHKFRTYGEWSAWFHETMDRIQSAECWEKPKPGVYDCKLSSLERCLGVRITDAMNLEIEGALKLSKHVDTQKRITLWVCFLWYEHQYCKFVVVNA